MEGTPKKVRRYDIDWLRVILFGLLIPFHVGIGVYWNLYGDEVNPNFEGITREERWEIAENGNDYTTNSVDLPSMILHWMHQWRLAGLFMISGMGTAFAFRNRTWGLFLKERVKRLLIPMFIGAWTMGFAGTIITENKDLDLAELTFEFLWGIIWRTLFFWVPFVGKYYALGHLWFLWNLFQYSLFLTPVFYLVRNYPNGKMARLLRSFFNLPMHVGILFIFPLLLVLTEIIFKPWFPGFIGMGYEWFWFLVFFLFGYICIIASEDYYNFIETKRMLISVLTTLWTIAFVWIRLEQESSGIPYVDGNWLESGIVHNSMTIVACIIHSFHAWFWCLTIFSWGAYFLNKPSKNLTYLNQGVYPFYIVHMPLTFAGLKIAGDLGLKNYTAVLIATIFVALACWLFFEIVRKTRVTRFMFGIKEPKLSIDEK
ncbi:MAG: acyltransferase family protein [Candidatus Poseidoniales archaeon]